MEELRSEAWERRKWSIVFRNPGLEESYQLGVHFFCFFFVFPSPYFIMSLDLGLVQMASAQIVPPPNISPWDEEFPCMPDAPNSYRMVPISCGPFELVQVHTRDDCLMLSCSFLFTHTVYAAQVVCAKR